MSTIGPEWSQLLTDLEKGFALLRDLPPAVTFFGGARITEDDPFYVASSEIGRLLAEKGVPPRTGAGPGIMTSVPEGYKSATPQRTACADDCRCQTGAYAKAMLQCARLDEDEKPPTQGIKIYLPFEPETNEAIDQCVELVTFPIRRLMLYENALAIVVFPGGIGTLDELFEVWARREAGMHSDPILLFGSGFFGPIVDAVRAALSGGARDLISPEGLEAIQVTDDPHEVVATVTQSDLIGFDEPPEVTARRLMEEIPYVAGVLRVAKQAVTILGGSTLSDGDPALQVVEGVLAGLAAQERATRIGCGGPVAKLALAAYANQREALQGFFLESAQTSIPDDWDEASRLSVSDPLAHKLLLTQNTSAFVALPGRVQVLDEIFSVLCEMQTGKREEAPIVLVGTDYWGPIFAACREVMLSEERQTVSPGDLDLVTLVDSHQEALAALSP